MKSIAVLGHIERKIYTVRGRKVMLDSDLAALYGVTTKRLNEQVRRNAERFPEDFMFRLTKQEYDSLRSQFATLDLKSQIVTSNGTGSNRSQFATGSQKHRDPRFLPYAFTEHGAVMAANVLNSPTAVGASIYVVRAFMKQRELLAEHKDTLRKLANIERHLLTLTKKVKGHDKDIVALISAIEHLMNPPRTHAIGFHLKTEAGKSATTKFAKIRERVAYV